MTLHIFDQHAPIYRQIFAALVSEIRAQYEPGEYLPSEQSLATRFGVNRHTVRRAIDELILEGIVERFRGRGTVVLDIPLVYPLQTGNRFDAYTDGAKTVESAPQKGNGSSQ